jgi:uncharacterized membrane protein
MVGREVVVFGFIVSDDVEIDIEYITHSVSKPEEFNIMYLIIGIAIATAIVSILIILIRRKLFKLQPSS